MCRGVSGNGPRALLAALYGLNALIGGMASPCGQATPLARCPLLAPRVVLGGESLRVPRATYSL